MQAYLYEVATWFYCEECQAKDYLLHVKKNIYSGKATGRVWYLYLCKKLQEVCFVALKIDDCVFYYKKCIYILFVDDSIIYGPMRNDIKQALCVL